MSDPQPCPTLQTQRLSLVPLSAVDAPGLWQLWTEPGFAEVAGIEVPKDPSVIASNIAYFSTLNQSGFYYKWAIKDQITQAFLGEFELYPMKPQIRPWIEWGIGFSLTPQRWRQGLMSEAINAVLRLAFLELGVLRVKADVLLHNERSLALLQKLGFVREGIQVQKTYLRSQFEDMYLLAMTRDRFFGITK
jgi:ribosomal-protein-alanine N-acetyltransferase